MSSNDKQIELRLLEYFSEYITPHKRELMEKVLDQRTRFFTVVLEDIYKPHNASAVLRTCDCFGIQDIHIIEKTNQYKINPYVTRGASDWVTIHKHFEPDGSVVNKSFSTLRDQGYQIFATSPAKDSMPIHELNADQKIALVFGNEHEGVSEEVKNQSDGLVHIPMLGFTESFNISVSASIFLFELINKVNPKLHPDFYLTEEEKHELRLIWYRQIVKNSEVHERLFREKNGI
ncbi:TrmH family RNA methyltransferase [Algoriphagus hitonicola]|uniref:tRNA (guanosine(18)-2'-O)-methyltransferase n=1 Tax=Algoriphagus hitonicola TaxID=435880 RepID=A0A1I2R1F8_9BACT|nr:RNA methyltransferase [Algoriphagus hitonicola]SFG34504.1 tRNA (guanosine-2'-O-)-methyltransferase [Algoriphagus hitonicola]